MTIWSSKTFTALGLLCTLSACEDFDTGDLLANLAPPEDAALPTVPLTQASMMRGGVTLVPPSGYCIDPDSLTQSFALMSRCDALGAATGGAGAPTGVLTVSIARTVRQTALPSAQELATAAGLNPPTNVRETETSVIFETSGSSPAEGLSSKHWRSAAQVGAFTIGAALFGPEGRRAVSNEGASVLMQMITRTIENTTKS